MKNFLITVSQSVYSSAVDIGGHCASTFGPILTATWACFTIAGVIAASVNMYYMFRTVMVYRRLLQEMLRGDFSGLPRKLPSATACVSDSLKFAGTQLAYLIFGWVVATFALCILFLFLTFTTVLPIIGVYKETFWSWALRALLINPHTLALGWFAAALVNYAILQLLVRFVFQVCVWSHKTGGV